MWMGFFEGKETEASRGRDDAEFLGILGLFIGHLMKCQTKSSFRKFGGSLGSIARLRKIQWKIQ